MKPSLDHVSILTTEVEKTTAFYREMLGMQLAARFYQAGAFDITFLADGTGSPHFSLEIIGPPFSERMQNLYDTQGPVMDHIAFVVDDVEKWHERLKKRGVEFVMPPTCFLGVKEVCFRDASGILAEVMTFVDAPPFRPLATRAKGAGGFEYTLHHASITCRNLEAMEKFYHDHVGMKTVLDARQEGCIFLADSALLDEKTRSVPLVEVLGPPGLWEREEAFLARRGPGIDHVSFLVDDVDAAYKALVAKGVPFEIEPTDFGTNRVAFFKDPNGLYVEIEIPDLVKQLADYRKTH